MAISDSSRQSLVPSFLYSSSSPFANRTGSTSSFSLSPSRSSGNGDALTSKNSFVIPALSEPQKIEMYSPAFYTACTAGGILSCGLTHMTVTPLDLVKCNMQDYEPPSILRLSLRRQVLLVCCAEFKAINDPKVKQNSKLRVYSKQLVMASKSIHGKMVNGDGIGGYVAPQKLTRALDLKLFEQAN